MAESTVNFGNQRNLQISRQLWASRLVTYLKVVHTMHDFPKSNVKLCCMRFCQFVLIFFSVSVINSGLRLDWYPYLPRPWLFRISQKASSINCLIFDRICLACITGHGYLVCQLPCWEQTNAYNTSKANKPVTNNRASPRKLWPISETG